MKNKIVLVLLIVVTLFTITGCGKKTEKISLMDYGEYKNITKENIEQIEIIKYTEAGTDSILVEDDSIISIYENLKKKKLEKKTNMSCDDNTTVYVFTLKDDSKISIEIECDWAVIGDDRYILK